MSTKFLTLKINPKNYVSKFNKTRAVYDSLTRDLVDKVAEFTQLTWQMAVPVRTGKLRASIGIKSKKTTKGSTDMRSLILVASDSPYYDFVDRGAKESAGRYVPFLGKRLINVEGRADFGFHPGQEAQNITNKVQHRVEKKLSTEVDKSLRTWSSVWGVEFNKS